VSRSNMGTKTTLYQEDWHSKAWLTALEKLIAPSYSCATSSVQVALQACLELLGTRTEIIPVIMPVTSAPDTLSAVLRSGAHPLLLDVDEETLQMDAEQLNDSLRLVTEQDKVPVVLFNRPFGNPIRPELLEMIQDLPSIVDSRLVPRTDLGEDDLCCTFNIFDLTPLCGAGGFVIHGFSKQVKQIKQVATGVMGLGGALPELLAKKAVTEIKLDCIEPLEWVKVPNARRAVATLAAEGIEAVVAVFPLYKLEEVKRRYSEEPEYPIAEKVENSYICVSSKALTKVNKVL
jgi:dTDP-4-amino-4,6-dideoxygalactose transaminase